MSKTSGEINQHYEGIEATSSGSNSFGNITQTIVKIGAEIKAHKIYLFTTFALALIGLIVCIPTVIVPKSPSSAER